MLQSIRAVAKRPIARRWLLATGLTLGLMAAVPQAKAQDTIKVGILHSLSGTMAISETTSRNRTRRVACLAKSSKRWWSIRLRTGRCSPRKRAN
jgi:hypothetical protein